MDRKPFRPAVSLLAAALLLAAAAPAGRATPPPVRIVAVGDIMMGPAWPDGFLPPDDGAGLFDEVRGLLAGGDIVFGNLEGPLADGGVAEKCLHAPDPKLCFAFRTPVRYARYLREAGFNTVNLANNHALDFGREGYDNTLAALDAVGIRPVGGVHVARFDVGGRRVAMLGFSYSKPGPHTLSLLDIPAAVERIRKLRAESDLVLVSFHGGAEGKEATRLTGGMETFAGEKRGDVERFARAAVDAGAALVLGHGPHVPRAIEVYRGKLIAYSLGNFLGYARFNLSGASGTGYALRVDLDPETGDFRSGRILPVRLVRRGIPEPDPDRGAVERIRRLTEEDLGPRGAVVEPDGTLRPPSR